MPRLITAALAAMLLTLAATSDAEAGGTISITNSDAVESLDTQITISGQASGTSNSVYATAKPVGSGTCAPNHGADTGTSFHSNTGYYSNEPYTVSRNYTFDEARAYLICVWLDGTNGASTASKVIDVRRPNMALSVSVAPTAITGQPIVVGWTWQLEARRLVGVYVVPNTGGCPPNASAADNIDVYRLADASYDIAGPPTSTTKNATVGNPGAYLVCGYVQYKSWQNTPQLTAMAPFTAVDPIKCVVPTFGTGSIGLGTLTSLLGQAHCTLGEVKYSASDTYKRGRVVSVSPGSGSTQAEGTAVSPTVSLGPYCRVPSVPRTRRISSTKRLIKKGHCRVGATRYTRSGYVKAKRVVYLKPSADTTQDPLTKVYAYVSVGKRGCRIPTLPRSRSLRSTKRRIRKAGCRVGTIKRTKSRRKRGRVVRTNPKPGSLRPKKWKVTIYVAKG